LISFRAFPITVNLQVGLRAVIFV